MSCGIVTQRAEARGITPGVNILEDVSTNLRGAGVTAKVIPLKKGQHVIQHKHEYDHLSLLMSGMVAVQTDDWAKVLDATEKPQSIVIKANEYHAVRALEDSMWVCIHPSEDY